MHKFILLLPFPLVARSGPTGEALPPKEEKPEWVSLFNGRDLAGWTPKFSGHPAGENYLNTFRVENEMLR